jgi:hypothetical protein
MLDMGARCHSVGSSPLPYTRTATTRLPLSFPLCEYIVFLMLVFFMLDTVCSLGDGMGFLTVTASCATLQLVAKR